MSEIGPEKLFLFPRKLEAILRADNFGVTDLSQPIVVELSFTNKCNLQCQWCSDASVRERNGGEMSTARLLGLLEDFKEFGVRGVTIEGGGEPTVHPGFVEVVRYAREIGLPVGLITNGVSRKVVEVADCFDWIRFSLDVSTDAEFAEMKAGGRTGLFGVVLDNIARVARTGPVVGVSFVVTRHGSSDLLGVVVKLRYLGVNYVQLRSVIDHDDMRGEHLVPIDGLKSLKSDVFDVMLSGLEQNGVCGNAGLPCSAHSLSAIVDGSGKVYLCGRLNVEDSWPPIGDLNDDTFMSIWLGEARKHQANLVRHADFCSENCPVCRMTKFNKLFHGARTSKTKNFL